MTSVGVKFTKSETKDLVGQRAGGSRFFAHAQGGEAM